MKNKFYTKLEKDQLYINEYIKDLKDYFYDLQDMRSDPRVQATRTYSRLKRENKTDDIISEKLQRDQFKYFKRYPHLINTTMILLAYSFLEGYLEYLASVCSEKFRNNIQEEIQDINIDIERSKLQIESLTNHSFEKINKLWKKIHQFREIRNCMLHYNSNVVRMGSTNLMKRLERSKQFEITKHGYIRVRNYKVVYDFLETTYDFLEGTLIILSDGKIKPVSIVTDWEQRLIDLIKKYPHNETTKYFKSKYEKYIFK